LRIVGQGVLGNLQLELTRGDAVFEQQAQDVRDEVGMGEDITSTTTADVNIRLTAATLLRAARERDSRDAAKAPVMSDASTGD